MSCYGADTLWSRISVSLKQLISQQPADSVRVASWRWGHPYTWRRSRRLPIERPIIAPTFTHSESSLMRCWLDAHPSASPKETPEARGTCDLPRRSRQRDRNALPRLLRWSCAAFHCCHKSALRTQPRSCTLSMPSPLRPANTWDVVRVAHAAF